MSPLSCIEQISKLVLIRIDAIAFRNQEKKEKEKQQKQNVFTRGL